MMDLALSKVLLMFRILDEQLWQAYSKILVWMTRLSRTLMSRSQGEDSRDEM